MTPFWIGAVVVAVIVGVLLSGLLWGLAFLRDVGDVADGLFPPAETRELQAWRTEDILRNVAPVDELTARRIHGLVEFVKVHPAQSLPLKERRPIDVEIQW